ncbi:hypothetical protein ASZ90_002920 [hydrocarbon metagenome]|uniref:Uncharacterized protein n=1 Tax=hydrocarbon metagenome TaxID=938273 RepID=A0A0W8G2F5_9ZZZZ
MYGAPQGAWGGGMGHGVRLWARAWTPCPDLEAAGDARMPWPGGCGRSTPYGKTGAPAVKARRVRKIQSRGLHGRDRERNGIRCGGPRRCRRR